MNALCLSTISALCAGVSVIVMGLAVTKQEEFWEACGFGNTERVRRLIADGIDVNWVSYTVRHQLRCRFNLAVSHLIFLWSPCGIGQTIIFSSCGFFFFLLLLSSFFSSPNLSRRRMDVCHTCTHGVALV